MTHDFLILPGSLAFDICMAEIPLPPELQRSLNNPYKGDVYGSDIYQGEVFFAPQAESGGILQPMAINQLNDYIQGGEYDLVNEELERADPWYW